MTRFERIFWLDDNPSFLGGIERLACHEGLQRGTLFDRITFAYDYQSGADIVRERAFDLYILDADFPQRMRPDRMKYVDGFVRNAIAGRSKWHDFEHHSGWNENAGDERAVEDNFVLFYEQNLQAKAGKTIVFSSSYVAVDAARRLRLPFYAKLGSAEEIASWLARSGQGALLASSSATWECGGMDELVERYLC